MLNKVIIFLIRRRLNLGPSECFRFTNQKTTDVYYFDTKKSALIKNKIKMHLKNFQG